MQKRNNDINQVSMSSIEPAANINSNSEEQDAEKANQTSSDGEEGKFSSKKSPEKDDSYIHPVEEQDIDNLQVSDIPEFTIGPGAMNSSMARDSKLTKEISSKSSPDKDEETPFKSLQNGVVQLKIDQIESSRKISQKPPQVLKQNQVQLKSSKLTNSKRNLLKKNVFESDMGLSTGRFETENIQQTLSKSANQAKVLNEINSQVQEFDAEPNGNLENEMRETSYFKQHSDDEGDSKTKPSNLGDLISIQNQKPQISAPPLMSQDASKGRETEDQKSERSKQKEGIQMFKISSRSQMKMRAARNSQKFQGSIQTGQQFTEQDPQSPLSPLGASVNNSVMLETPTSGVQNRKKVGKGIPAYTSNHSGLDEDDQVQRSHSLNPQNLILSDRKQIELNIDDEEDLDQIILNNGPLSASNKSRRIKVKEKDLNEIQRVNQQNEKHATANFGVLNVQKQMNSQVAKNNYSALKGGQDDEILDDDSSKEETKNQMFTSMSDIGFPSNIHNYNIDVTKKREHKEELITPEQVQRMMDTQNNWRVRTKTIDELLHDVKLRVEHDSEYMMDNSEKFLDFFVGLLTDQNFKIVLNTLNILNMIIWMPQQRKRFEKILKHELSQDICWGLSNATLGRHIPLIVKKLADSKNIIRQEAIRCLFGINEIMRSGNKKDNNFIPLILPYLNNSSNWHIREELLHLLIKCFLSSKDAHEFDSYQILDSILQLFGDTKEKIRNLALEAIAAFASIGDRKQMVEILFQLNVDKDVRELVQSRLEYGMYPTLNIEGNVEIPYQEITNNNFDVDSVAHSVTNQTQISQKGGYQEQSARRKQSIGVSSQLPPQQIAQMRGNSSGRKIVVTTANNQNLGVSYQDEIMQQAFLQSKRTASANNPAQLEFENNLPIGHNMISDQNPANSFSYSVGGKGGRDQRMMPQFDDLSIPHDLNASSFLPKLQNANLQYSSQQYQRERVVGSSGGASMGYMGPPEHLMHQPNMPISGGNKRSNKYLHGTPGHPQSYQAHFSQNGTNLQNQFNRGNSGKVLGNFGMNNSISNKSPSLYDQNTTLFDMSGNVGSLLGGGSGQGQHIKHMSNMAPPNLQLLQNSHILSENGEPDLLSVAGAHSNHHQTPSSFNQDQILYSAGGYRAHYDQADFENSSFNLGIPHRNRDSRLQADMLDTSPSNRNHINFMDGAYNAQQPARRQQAQGAKNNQNTFYSDGTTFTGITATTGATSQNRGNKIIQMKGAGPPQHNLQMAHENDSSQNIHRGPGPIKAVRNFGGDEPTPTTKKPLKMRTKERQSRDSLDEGLEDQNRSFSYNKSVRSSSKTNLNVKEAHSVGLQRSREFGSSDPSPNGEDPALMTQSSKIVYMNSKDLEPLDKPEKEFKKATQGIKSEDWFEQFEACNIIRRVCKHHQSLILQTGNQLQGLVGILIKLTDSLRSAVSRIALITFNDMFQSLKRVMEPCLDPILKILLKKGTDTNQFIAQEADKCLVSMVNNCQDSKVLQILQIQNGNNRSTLYRLKMCFCLQCIVKNLGNKLLFFRENDKLLVLLSNYLQDANQEVRQQAKIAFVSMSQAIMGQNELEKLLQRVLNEVQYRKVKEFLDKEPTHLITNQGSQIDFVITNANNQNVLNKKLPNKAHQQSFKSLRPQNNLAQKHNISENQDQILNIQAKSILNLQQEQSSGFLNKIASQQKPEGSKFGENGPHDQFFIDSIKELILKTQVNEWRLRLESSEQLFDLISQNISKFSKTLKMVELADALCKLLNDSNAKIQIQALENFNKIFQSIFQFVETYIQMFYKSIISNLGSSNVGVRKNSEQILKNINDSITEKGILLQPLANMIQYNSNARLKPALIEQLIDIVDHLGDLSVPLQKIVLPVAFKCLDDNKNEVKSRTEKLLKKLHGMLGQQVLDACPQVKLQRVCDICLSKNMSMAGTNSSGKASQGGFGANGNQLQLNSRN